MLASIQKVLKVDPIEGADKIEKIKVLGWELVAAKGEFKEGDICVYIEIDTVVPDKPEFEFLKKYNFRIKTIKLRGQISQGISLPFDLKYIPFKDYKIGDDVSELIGVEKYEKPIPLGMGGKIRRAGLPFGIPITDETRVQSIPDIINELYGVEVYFTTKCDGTSATYAIKNEDYHVCSRNNSYFKDEKNVYWKISDKYQIEEQVKSSKKNIAIRGEICGPGIQNNKLKLKDHDLFVFDVLDLDSYEYYNYPEILQICHLMGLNMVPLDHIITEFKYTLEELLVLAKGLYKGTTNRREGIVGRPVSKKMISASNKGRMSFKVLNNDYLLKDEE